MANQTVSPLECEAIRKLSDFDITMLLSEIHERGWLHGRTLLRQNQAVSDMFDDHDAVMQEARASTPPDSALVQDIGSPDPGKN